MLHMPAAHTDGDIIVWFRGSDVIATGDVFSTVTYPIIDRARGGSVQGILDGRCGCGPVREWCRRTGIVHIHITNIR